MNSSRKSRSGKSVKWIENIGYDEVVNSRILSSILKSIKNGHEYVFMLQTDSGFVEKYVRNVLPNEKTIGDPFKDPFNDRISMICVKLHYWDGSWEYGFKHFHEERMETGARSLFPIYLRDGAIDEYTGEANGAEECDATGTGMIVPYRILRKIPLYNEKMRDRVLASKEKKSKPAEYRMCEHDDEELVCDVIGSPYVRRLNVNYGKPPIKAKTGKMAWGEDYTYQALNWFERASGKKYSWYSPSQSTYYTCFCEDGSRSSYYMSDPDDDKPKVRYVKYSYLKSCYERNFATRIRNEVFPVSSLLSIAERRLWGAVGTEECLGEEVWNNLDQAVRGVL